MLKLFVCVCVHTPECCLKHVLFVTAGPCHQLLAGVHQSVLTDNFSVICLALVSCSAASWQLSESSACAITCAAARTAIAKMVSCFGRMVPRSTPAARASAEASVRSYILRKGSQAQARWAPTVLVMALLLTECPGTCQGPRV